MKLRKFKVLLIVFGVTFMFGGCVNKTKSDLKCMEVIKDPTSFSEREVEDAMESVKIAFINEFKNATLEKLLYSEDFQDSMLVKSYSDDESIVIISSISKNDTESIDYYCLLTRSRNGEWIVRSWDNKQ